MDERCKTAHAKLLAGTCPWCGQAIVNGQSGTDVQPLQEIQFFETSVSFTELGISLKQKIEQAGPLGYIDAARYAEEIARQLSDFHQTQPFHGNVRPSNIFLNQDGSVELGPSAERYVYSVIDEEAIPGVVDCLAPEQALNVSRTDGRADIYSLGCTLYFLLAGRPPFPDGSVAERLFQHQTAKPESLSRLRTDVPAALVQICETMMAKKPDDRYQSAVSIVLALSAFRS